MALSGTSAGALNWRFAAYFMAADLLFVVLSLAMRPFLMPQGTPTLILEALSLAVLWLLLRSLAPIGDRLTDELSKGYTTLEMPFGGFTTDRGQRDWRTGWRTPWDFDTVWVLDRTGRRVVRPPTRRGDPPGFYPSPTRSGSLELWTDQTFTTFSRDRDQPRIAQFGELSNNAASSVSVCGR